MSQKKVFKNDSESVDLSDTSFKTVLRERFINKEKPECCFCSESTAQHNNKKIQGKHSFKNYVLRRKPCKVDGDYHYIPYDGFDYTLETFLKCKDYVNVIKEVILSMVLALLSLHKYNIFHYNINPKVIVLVKDSSSQKYEIKFLDFFLSRDDRREHIIPICNSFEQNDFSAPELINLRKGNLNEIDDKSADVFSLGCCIFFLITGYHPYERYGTYKVSNILNKNFEIKFETIDYVKCLREYQKFLAEDLLKTMLTWDPKKRNSLESALNHPFFWSMSKINKVLIENFAKLEKFEIFLTGEYFNDGRYEGLTELLNKNNPYNSEKIKTRSSPQRKDKSIDNKAINKSNGDDEEFYFARLITFEYPSTLIDLYNNHCKQNHLPKGKISSSKESRKRSPKRDLSMSPPKLKPKKSRVDSSSDIYKKVGPLLRSHHTVEIKSS